MRVWIDHDRPPFRSAPSLVVLHTLRIAGRAPASTLPELTGLSLDVIETELRAALDAGDVVHRDGVMAGWSLTPGGRERHVELLAHERASARCDAVILAGYDDFIALDGWFKRLCTEWQLHDQPTSCVQRLHDRHHQVDAIARRLGDALTRFLPYAPRFATALARLRAGDADALTRPLTGSYHDVWMHLHEDLLLTLGRDRSRTDGA
jgi:hypothetical protein